METLQRMEGSSSAEHPVFEHWVARLERTLETHRQQSKRLPGLEPAGSFGLQLCSDSAESWIPVRLPL